MDSVNRAASRPALPANRPLRETGDELPGLLRADPPGESVFFMRSFARESATAGCESHAVKGAMRAKFGKATHEPCRRKQALTEVSLLLRRLLRFSVPMRAKK